MKKSKMINLLEDGRVFLDYGPIRMLMDISIQEQRKPELAYIVCKHVINEFKRACKYMSVLKGISPIKRSIGSYPISVQKMITSIKRLKDNTFTPLAAVAGAFSDIALEKALRLGAQRAIINNGGDIAFADMRGNPIKVGIPVSGNNLGVILNLTFAGKNIGGICTSGVGGRSFTKGIATAAVAIAENAALADTCATYLGNETNVDAPEIIRCYAEEIDSETDIAGHQITLKVGCLNQKDTYCALLNGVKAAENLYKRHMIQGAVICIGNEVTSIPEDLILLWKEDSENFT